jgi:hypothetical protein
MRKVYVKPAVQTYEVEIQSVIAQTSGDSVPMNQKTDASETSPNLSDKRHSCGSLW